jgi:hypothetical protein
VTLIVAKWFRYEGANQLQHLSQLVLASAYRDYVCIIVLPCQNRGGLIPDQCRADTFYLVGSYLFAISRATEDDAQGFHTGTLVSNHCQSGVDAEGWVIVQRVILGGAVVNEFVTICSQLLNQKLGEVEAGVVGSDVDAHYFFFFFGRLGAGA